MKSKASRGLVTRRIVYRDRRHPHEQLRELKVDVSRRDVMDDDYAAAMVAVRTVTPLAYVQIIRIAE